mgnify:CR=1 FL=1
MRRWLRDPDRREGVTDQELLTEYWEAQAQFGPFDMTPEEFLRRQREDERKAQ